MSLRTSRRPQKKLACRSVTSQSGKRHTQTENSLTSFVRSNYSFKPRPLRGSANAVSCTTSPSRCAVRLNSGVSSLWRLSMASKFDWAPYQRFIEEFKNETDRAAVILGCAKLDSMLYQILDRHLLPSLSSNDELLEGDSPLSTFSSRINACYRLGLIDANYAKTLHTIRKVRNSFAHDLAGCSLDNGPQSDRIKAILLPARNLGFFKKFKTHFFGEESSCSIEFRAFLALISARLEFQLIDISAVSASECWPLIKESWVDEKLTTADGPQKES